MGKKKRFDGWTRYSNRGFLQPIPELTPVIPLEDKPFAIDSTVTPYESSIIFFYMTWYPCGAFSNFSPYPIKMDDDDGDYVTWPNAEHCYKVRSDWDNIKIDVMYKALKCKFSIYPHLNSMLLSTAGSVLVEASPHDLFCVGEGLNFLGRLLMQLRSEFLGECFTSSESTCLAL
ncbi:hypothetical protein GH714_043427 [Hevea brasiliensis]|uniref:NADAR domain-containing protein n=1 Tax=Hevea brasiliensis TaxID=3981 RepID=A0A6A6K3K0_HEVBR|nr:hypothetical protein GH714_043427 [Hevea brasiliensis]